MKVLQINSVCGIRSTGRICTDIADVLMQHGHERRIAYGREIVPEQYHDISIRIGNDNDVRLHALRTRLSGQEGMGSKRATQQFINWVREYDPDIIHLHNLHGYFVHLETLFEYLHRCGKPIVWTLHDCWAFTGHCGYFDYVGCDKWREQCNKCPLKREYPASWVFDRSKAEFARKKRLFCEIKGLQIVTPSQWLADQVAGSFMNSYRVSVIPNGIDTHLFRQTDSDIRIRNGIGERMMILGVASAWSKRKGLDDFLELARRLDDNCWIVLVGLSDAQMAGLPENVIGVKLTNSVTALAQYYSAADVFINMSREETMGLTTVEAAACGTPSIVYDATAVPETVDSTSGIVVKPGDFDAILAAISEVMDGRFLSEDCIKHARKYEKAKLFGRYIGLYEAISHDII